MSRKQTIFVGDKFIIKGQEVEVTIYNNSLSIGVRFCDGYETFSRSSRIKSGNIRNPRKITIAGHGYTGEGCHAAMAANKTYMVWVNMLNRCYSADTQKRAPTYKGCSVSPEWFNFQVFADWYESIFTGAKIEWELDKDLAVKGNRIYSKETCIPLPSELNCLLIKSEKSRGTCPVGVSWHSRDSVYQANCNIGGRDRKYLGYFNTAESAFLAYKKFKENFIKDRANKWKSQIDPRAYEALMNYQVEITD